MNPLDWYLAGARPKVMQLPYYNWKDFQFGITTIDSLPINIDFGDGIIQSFPHGGISYYSKSVASDGVVAIYTPDRLRTLTNNQSGIYRVDWNFSLSTFRLATNLTSFDFRSGNIYGDVGNLSPLIETFQILRPSYGILKNQSPLPLGLKIFSCNVNESEFEFNGSQIIDEMPNLESLTVDGKSQVYTSLDELPPNLKLISLSNYQTRKHRISYATFVIGQPNNMERFVIDCEDGFGFNSAELDLILNYLATLSWHPTRSKSIRLTFGHGTRTSASDSAVATLSALTPMNIVLN